jgi:hypothetical protein
MALRRTGDISSAMGEFLDVISSFLMDALSPAISENFLYDLRNLQPHIPGLLPEGVDGDGHVDIICVKSTFAINNRRVEN